MDNFGKKLRQIRKEKGISQKDLAHHLGVGQSTIANYENNLRFPNMEKLLLLSDILEVSVDTLIGKSKSAQEIPTEYIDFHELKEKTLSLLLAHEEEKALDFILENIEQGLDPIDLYVKILEPILHEVGHLWKEKILSVGMEHYITAIISDMIAKIPLKKQKSFNIKRVLLMTPESESHYIGLKMLKKIFEKYGWKAYLVGNNIPFTDLNNMLVENQIDVLAFSITMSEYVNSLGYIISALKEKKEFESLRIIVGGQASHTNNIERTLPDVDYFVDSLYDIKTIIKELE